MSGILDAYQKTHVVKYPNDVTSQPLISICVITYNHVKFIKECLNGILNQKMICSFEIIIGEDESTDGTREICIEYAKKYPDLIRLFFHSRENTININGQPTGRFNFVYNLSEAKGKYVAFCEGDDYWTDPYKLQKQVDFLETNPSYSMSSHSVKTVYEGFQNRKISLKRKAKLFIKNALINNSIFDGSNYYSKFHEHADFEKIINSPLFIATNSMVIKSETLKNLPDWFLKLHAGHMALILIATSHGPNYHFKEIMGVKRKNPGGITQNPERMSYLKQTRVKYQIFMYENLNQYLDYKKSYVINKKLKTLYFKQLKKDLFSGNIKESIYYLKKTFSLIGK